MSRSKLGINKFSKISRFLLIFLLVFSWIFSGWPRIWQKPAIPPKIQEVRALTCGFGTEIAGGQCRGYLTTTGAQTWSVPSDWNDNNNTIEVIGGGGGGGNAPSNAGAGGGGGGAYTKVTNVNLPEGQNVAYYVGAGGSGGTSPGGTGGDTYLCNSTANCSSIDGSAVVIGAKGGAGGQTSSGVATGGAGGAAASCKGVGSTVVCKSGGNGGNGNGAGDTGGGGGGAGGPKAQGGGDTGGDGAAGGIGDDDTTDGPGGGGGGGGGGYPGQNHQETTGGKGGNNYSNTGGGSGGNGAAGGAGTNGGGGGGGDDGKNGGAGGAGQEWDSTHGSGGGGGGAGDGGNGGAGALYGGGGGGAEGTGGNGAQGIIVITYTPLYTTTLGNGTDPSNSTNEPGTTNYLDQFSFVTDSGTDTVTGLTVTTANTSAIASMKICSNDDNCTTQYFNTVTSPSGDNWSFSGGTSIPVTTAASSYRVVFTAKDHSSLTEGTYAVTGYVSAFTCSNNQAGSDSAGTTITIDNAPPSNATWGTITPGDQQIALNWSNPESDFYKVLILRKAGSAITDAPTDGTEYSVPGTIGDSTIIYVNNGTSFTDTGLTNGTDYYYKIFAHDQYKNYASGSGTGPHQPVAVSISLTTDGSISFGTLEFNETRDTTPSDLNDPETVKVDSGPADLEIKTTIFSGGGNNWSLGTSNGSEQVKWEFQKSGGSWTTFETANSLYVLENNVPQGESRTIYFRLTTPNQTVSSADHSATITIVASPPD